MQEYCSAAWWPRDAVGLRGHVSDLAFGCNTCFNIVLAIVQSRLLRLQAITLQDEGNESHDMDAG